MLHAQVGEALHLYNCQPTLVREACATADVQRHQSCICIAAARQAAACGAAAAAALAGGSAQAAAALLGQQVQRSIAQQGAAAQAQRPEVRHCSNVLHCCIVRPISVEHELLQAPHACQRRRDPRIQVERQAAARKVQRCQPWTTVCQVSQRAAPQEEAAAQAEALQEAQRGRRQADRGAWQARSAAAAGTLCSDIMPIGPTRQPSRLQGCSESGVLQRAAIGGEAAQCPAGAQRGGQPPAGQLKGPLMSRARRWGPSWVQASARSESVSECPAPRAPKSSEQARGRAASAAGLPKGCRTDVATASAARQARQQARMLAR